MTIHFDTTSGTWHGEEFFRLTVQTYYDFVSDRLYVHVIEDEDPATGEMRDRNLLCRLKRVHEQDFGNILAYDADDIANELYPGEMRVIKARLATIEVMELRPAVQEDSEPDSEPETTVQTGWQLVGF